MNTHRRGESAALVDPYRGASPARSEDGRELGPRYLALRAHVRCTGCAKPVPVNAPHLRVQCPACQTTMQIPPTAYAEAIDTYEAHHHRLHGASDEVEVEDVDLVVTLWGADPDARTDMVQAPMPPWLVDRCPTARRIWISPPRGGTETEITYGCPRCQAALSLTASSPRVTDCHGCGGRIFVPESLWTQLYGPVRMHTWIVELHGENRFDRQTRLRHEHERRQRAAEAAALRREVEREAAEEARDKAALDRDLTKLHRRARVWTALHTAIVVAAIAAPWVVHVAQPGPGWMPLAVVGGYLAALVFGAIGLGAGASIMTRVTGDHDLMFPVWFNYVFVVTIPVMGHLLGFEAIHGLRRGRYAERYGRHADFAALNWAIITIGGLAIITSIIIACVL